MLFISWILPSLCNAPALCMDNDTRLRISNQNLNHRKLMKMNPKTCLPLLTLGALLSQPALAAPPQQVDRVAEVLLRQDKKGDHVQVYLRDTRASFINGKQISLAEIGQVLRRSYAKKVTISAEPKVPVGRVDEIKELVRNHGVREIEVTSPPNPRPIKKPVAKEASRKEYKKTQAGKFPTDPHEANIIEILNRQQKKGDELTVYLRDARRIYVNGRQITIPVLQEILRRAKASKGVVSAEPHVLQSRVDEIRGLISQSGIQDIQVTIPKMY